MKIAFTGVQSTGKTTLVNELKKNPVFKDYTFSTNLTRQIKELGFKINEEASDETQIAIMIRHSENIKNENLICDRCVLDCLSYTFYLYNHKKVSHETLAFLKSFFFDRYINKYDVIFYLKPEFAMENDNVRSVDEEFRDEMVKIFDKIILEEKIPVVKLTGTVEERMKKIYETLKEKGLKC